MPSHRQTTTGQQSHRSTSYKYNYSIVIAKFQWSQHNLQSNYAGSAEETNPPFIQNSLLKIWRNLPGENQRSRKNKMHLPWILFWLCLFIQEFNEWSVSVGLGTFLEIDLFNHSCLGSPDGVLHRTQPQWAADNPGVPPLLSTASAVLLLGPIRTNTLNSFLWHALF